MLKGDSSNDKIIPFPKLELRLLQKGKDYLGEGKIKEAIDFLEQAKTIDEENADIVYTLTAAYIKLGNMEMAKATVEEMLRIGIGDYFDTMEMYISILFQLHDYKKIQQLITLLMEEHQIPFDKMDQYQELLQLCERMTVESIKIEKKIPANPLIGDPAEIIGNLSDMDAEDIQVHIEEINQYLMDEHQNPFIKTVLLNVLIEKGFDHTVKVKKFGEEVEISLAEYPETRNVEFSQSIKRQIAQRIEQDDPIFHEYANILADRFFFYVYPLEKNFTDINVWTEAIIQVVKSYMDGNSYHSSDFDDENGSKLLNKAISFILMVDKNFNN